MVTDTEDHRLNSYVELALSRLRDMGLSVDPASIYCAPFRVEFGPRLKGEMSRAAQLFDSSARVENGISQLDATSHHFEVPATLVDAENEQSRSSARRTPARGSDAGDSGDAEANLAGLHLQMPLELIERLAAVCHDQQLTPAALVLRLVEEYLDGCRYP